MLLSVKFKPSSRTRDIIQSNTRAWLIPVIQPKLTNKQRQTNMESAGRDSKVGTAQFDFSEVVENGVVNY